MHSVSKDFPLLTTTTGSLPPPSWYSERQIDAPCIHEVIGKDKKVAVGVASHRRLLVDQPGEVARLIRQVPEHIEPERLLLGTDCGFGREGMSGRHAVYEMVAIVRGANIVRQEPGLPTAAIPATDERFSLLDA